MKSMAFMGSVLPATLVILLSILFFNCFISCRGAPHAPVQVHKKPAECPKDGLKFGECSSWLGLVGEVIGDNPSSQCCDLIDGLADLEAAACLCTAIKANVLGIKLKAPIALSLLVNGCGKKVPEGFVC
ncbi:hypothetical protein Nepgr_019067 [Nepenthes gracilis]|uniref:Bifunctional inhibitor/plant lipid transfer protein/seed storage helical domain-containing protein n=1 Tax=Nepenthes gracilis TaxID=150966 RepID=A0AAD3SWA5_NEPGR|nr:hypothetical protein Nepgr_019067 [Nepenthes gracilis]